MQSTYEIILLPTAHNSLSLSLSGLYPGLLQTGLPHSNFRLITEENNQELFRFLASKIISTDVDFFLRMMQKESTGFVFEIELDYDKEKSMQTCIDFCAFPYLKSVGRDMLSQEQIQKADTLKRHLHRERAKLITSFEDRHTVTDFCENILFLTTVIGMSVRTVKSIISFNTYDYLEPYVNKLQISRRDTVSPITGKLVKSLGKNNNLLFL